MCLNKFNAKPQNLVYKIPLSHFSNSTRAATVKVTKILPSKRREDAKTISSTQLSPCLLSWPDRYRKARPRKWEKKEEETEEAKFERDLKLRGYPAALKSLAIPVWDNSCFRTCLRAMRAMEVRLNIDFSYAVGETKGEKRSEREITWGHLPISGNDSATGSHCL